MNIQTILAKNTRTTLQNEHTWGPIPLSALLLQVFGQFFVLRMTQPTSSYTMEWSNIDGGRREEGASDILSFVFYMVSRESFATLSQSLLARIVD